jgi:hypothetical protein
MIEIDPRARARLAGLLSQRPGKVLRVRHMGFG